MEFQQLGPYRIEKQIGRGGMGTVFSGVAGENGGAAAVKVLSIHLAQDEGFRERFEAEIETLRKLRHPNIVRLYGFGEQDGVLFYAMELVEGTSLEDELRRGRRFDWREATRIGIQLCRALRHAHDRGVIHRDIKPANLLLLSDGSDLKLSDFGIAKLFGSSGMTADGGVIGTADYMAPEQADGRPVTHRADLYSVGGVLYALLAGRPPFQARSLPEMLHMQRFAEPEPLRSHAPDVPHEFEEIVRDLLVKDPELRIPNAQVLARRLEAMEHGLVRRLNRDAPSGEMDIHNSATAIGVPPSPANGAEPVDADKTQIGSQGEFSLGPAPSGAASDLGATQAATNLDDLDQAPAFWTKPGTPGVAAQSPSAASDSFAVGPVSRPTGSSASVTPAKPPRRFVSVSEEADELDRDDGAPRHPLISAQTLVLVVALVSMGAFVWYLLQPPSADALYQQVRAIAAEGQPERLAEVEGDIKEFLNYYPEDNRGREMQRYLDEVDLYRLEARYRRGARQARDLQAFTPLERAYAEALRLVSVDPDRGARKLRALLELYGSETGHSDREQQCLTLAQRELERFYVDPSERTDDLQRLEQRLSTADALTDRAAARPIYQGLIEIYGDKPWARSAVERAEQKLAEPPPSTASPPSAASPTPPDANETPPAPPESVLNGPPAASPETGAPAAPE